MSSSRPIRWTIDVDSPTAALVGLHFRPWRWHCAGMSGRFDDGGSRVRHVRLAFGLSNASSLRATKPTKAYWEGAKPPFVTFVPFVVRFSDQVADGDWFQVAIRTRNR
jgi:hypothetical protein